MEMTCDVPQADVSSPLGCDELGRIHPAVQRPGRSRASIQFPAFSAAEAAGWCLPEVAAPKSEKTLQSSTR